MGCCASQPATTTATNTPPPPASASKSKPDTTSKTATEGSSKTSAAPPQQQQQQPKPTMNNSTSETPASAPPAASPAPAPTPVPAPAPAATPATGGAGGGAANTTPGSYVAPAPGVKAVRAAYKGKGWAPPQKEYTTNEKKVGDKTRIEIQDEWDDDGNLRRTTVKHIITPDWKKKTEKTIEIIPADEAEKMGLGKKN